jgi:hypothetical protein
MNWMDPAAFDLLLSGDLGTRVCWEQSHKCPCVEFQGGASQECPVCDGLGTLWEAPSTAFRAGVTVLQSRDVARQSAKAEGLIGDGQISIPSSAPCYGEVKPFDRFLVPDATDAVEWLVSPRSPVRLPAGAVVLGVTALSNGTLVQATLPAPGADGRIRVTHAATVRLRAPKRYEVIDEAGHMRAWQPGLPEKWSLKRIDVTTR